MSTYLYLECRDHAPVLRADDESGQHLYDLPQIRADIVDRDAIVAGYLDDRGPAEHFRRNTAAFLAAHRSCELGIRDEYGRPYDLADTSGAGGVTIEARALSVEHRGRTVRVVKSGLTLRLDQVEPAVWVGGEYPHDGEKVGDYLAPADSVELLPDGA